MSWNTSNRRSRLPSNWSSLRKEILERDGHRCTWIDKDYVVGVFNRCTEEATEVDHIKNNDDNSPENLRSLCHRHHAHKTSWESSRAKALKLKKVKSSFRRTEENPALDVGLSVSVDAAPLHHRSGSR